MEGSNISSEDFAVGCLLSIKTTLGEEFEGQVITFDRPSNILVLHILLNFSLLIIRRNNFQGSREEILFLVSSLTVFPFCLCCTRGIEAWAEEKPTVPEDELH
ncbi:hypothetical protein LINPERPRIM_LOCUS28292 [Linum perenne]